MSAQLLSHADAPSRGGNQSPSADLSAARPSPTITAATATTTATSTSTTTPRAEPTQKGLTSSRRSTALLSRPDGPQSAKEKDPGRGQHRALTNSPPALDPLSTNASSLSRLSLIMHSLADDRRRLQQIFLRTNSTPSEPSIAHRLRNPSRPVSPASEHNLHDTLNKPSNGVAEATRERKKGPSFLSRLGMRAARKRDDDMPDSDSELGDARTDGNDARALTSVTDDGGGYIPLYKGPTSYIRVRSHNKKERRFNRLFLAQELLGTKHAPEDEVQTRAPATAVGTKILKAGDAIWAAEFSVDGRYLAVAGKDQAVRVFSVISTPEDRKAHEEEEEQNRGHGQKLSAPVFHSKPTREFEGHTGEVLALSWSKNNFLLSSSMDKTVRLWHMSRTECLCVFSHDDLVTSIAFHPTDDRFFLAGSLDAQLRLWSIPDKAVAYSAQANEFITAVAFAPDGKTAICGLLGGQCMFYETEGLNFQFHIHVRSSRGKNAKGSKITGIRTARVSPDSEEGDVRVLVSSNDSRVRIYSLKTRMLEVKFRGLENQSSQIHARFGDDAMHVISGSEDRRAYIWAAGSPEAEFKDKQPYECFDAHPQVVTTALMAPVESRLLLSASGDPIYDLCNPPPVTLMSLDEKTASEIKVPDGAQTDDPPGVKRPEESPAYIERCKHAGGDIIVTTDKSGIIKVFRQDCAHNKRLHNTWETGSRFSGKLAGIDRSASIVTRTSGSSRVHSRRGSLGQGPVPALAQLASDRIMSWRRDIEGRMSTSGATTGSERSMSPIKPQPTPVNTSAANLASEARRLPYASGPVVRPNNPSSPTSSLQTSRTSLKLPRDKDQAQPLPPTPSFSLISASDSDGHHEDKVEGGFWNRWRGGISARRYLSVAGSSANQQTASDRRASEATGLNDKVPGRRSVNEMRKARLIDDDFRRRSIGPSTLGRPKVSEPEAKAEQAAESNLRFDSAGQGTTDATEGPKGAGVPEDSAARQSEVNEPQETSQA
ncbi:hypothetical protein XA68_14477 [Ophiocordyceps unilateralis]|uniref:Uncharacterized protein n=1 Tax=Ophiocordyceps unilateralis TaxID=268505 RepID=A0A2A9P969_OPHUN|nr:hypothetical protein XA68_14477 [Ophiocordyceps unilateralis]